MASSPFWTLIGMPRIREQLREEIRGEVQAGRLHSFWQYPELLEPYDDHDGIIEGMEDAEIRVHDDDTDPSSDEDEVAQGRGEEQRDMEELPKGGGAEKDETSAGSSSGAAPACAPHGAEARASVEIDAPAPITAARDSGGIEAPAPMTEA